MKKLLFFMLSTILLFMLMSCADDSNGGSSSSGFPTLPEDFEEDWSELGFSQVISFSPYTEYYYSVVDLISYEEPEEWEFRLNGEDIDIEWYDGEEREDEVWWAEVDEGDLPEGVDLSSGSTVSYYLKVNDTTSSGNLKMCYQLDVNWDEFDFNEDFAFDWEIQQNPNLHYIFMGFDCEIDEEEYEIYKNWQLSGSQRAHTIPKNLYQQYEDCDYYSFWVAVAAINFRNTGECIAMSVEGDGYDSGDWRSDKKFDKKERMKRILEAFKNNSQE